MRKQLNGLLDFMKEEAEKKKSNDNKSDKKEEVKITKSRKYDLTQEVPPEERIH